MRRYCWLPIAAPPRWLVAAPRPALAAGRVSPGRSVIERTRRYRSSPRSDRAICSRGARARCARADLIAWLDKRAWSARHARPCMRASSIRLEVAASLASRTRRLSIPTGRAKPRSPADPAFSMTGVTLDMNQARRMTSSWSKTMTPALRRQRSRTGAGRQSLLQPRTVVAGVQPARDGGIVQFRASADRAVALPVDLWIEPRRILHGAGRRVSSGSNAPGGRTCAPPTALTPGPTDQRDRLGRGRCADGFSQQAVWRDIRRDPRRGEGSPVLSSRQRTSARARRRGSAATGSTTAFSRTVVPGTDPAGA